MAPKIAIIGLGQIGASVGMALKEAHSPLRRVGFDKDIGVARAAQTLDAVDAISTRLPDAVRDADIVLLALPLGQIHEMLASLSPYLKENSVIMDTAPIKGSITKTMQALREGRYYVGLVPAITVEAITAPEIGLRGARPDLFKRTAMIIDAPSGTPQEVEQLAINFSKLLGAKPMLTDLSESDGLMASAHILPQLAAAALLNATVDQPGWSDGRKLAGRPFAGVTGGLAYYDDPDSLEAAALANPTAVLHALDILMDSLQDLRGDIASGDEAALRKRLQDAFEARERWLNERTVADWLSEGGEAPDLPNLGEQLTQMFFGSRIIDRNKRKKEKP